MAKVQQVAGQGSKRGTEQRDGQSRMSDVLTGSWVMQALDAGQDPRLGCQALEEMGLARTQPIVMALTFANF